MKLTITNMNVKGKIKFTKAFDFTDLLKLQLQSAVDTIWIVVNEFCNPMLCKKVDNNKVKGSMTLFRSGTVIIMGIKTLKDAEKMFQILLDDLNRANVGYEVEN